MFKKTIIILACGALIAPVALAQTRSTDKKQTTAATEQPITVTGTTITTTRKDRRRTTSPSRLSSFVKTVRILRAVMF